MPQKIGFTVINWSGHEENYSAKELMVHAPTVNGWRSARFCQFPQEITLQMVERCRIRKLQLLAHQYMISAKVEFHIGDRQLDAASPQQFRRLGYVSLSSNEKTGFRARELKSVHVDATGTHLKLTFHRNHINQYNPSNQVALVAINILGDPANCSDVSPIPDKEQLVDRYLSSTQHSSALDVNSSYVGCKYESISPLDDLAFDMYQDPEIAHIIRILDDKKQEMVRLEKYDLAKKLKQAIADLQKVGERLGRYDVENQSAIEREDYDTAKEKKEQLEAYRLQVYQQLELHDLLEIRQIQRLLQDAAHCDAPPSNASHLKHTTCLSETPKKSKQGRLLMEQEQVPGKATSPQHTLKATVCTPSHRPRTEVSSPPYDERPLPALKKRPGEQPLPQPEQPALMDLSTPRSAEPEALSEKAQREASLSIEVYGESLVAGAYSKTWSYREDALLAVYKKLAEIPAGTPKADLRNMMKGAVFLCTKALTDKVSSVFQASLKLLRMILSEFVSSHQLGRSEITYCVEQTWPALLSRTSESTPRLRTLAISFIQEMALCKEVRALQIIPAELVKPIKSSMPARLTLSRLELLGKLLEQLGTNDSGFTVDSVMRFLAGTLEHSAASVRELAVCIVQAMYRLHGNTIQNYLPSDDASTRKNVLYKNLFDSFAKIDGKVPGLQALKKGEAHLGEGEREKEEIKCLQEQLAALKEISEQGKDKNKSPEKKTEKPTNPGVKGGTYSISADAKGRQSAVSNYLDNLCIFCGERDKSFTEEGLDLHYWKHCPMLCRCLQCRQVVEIASLTEHLISECEHRANFTQCPLCSEAISKDELTGHTQSTGCNPLPVSWSCNHCPLCHQNIPPGEEGWKSHLMDSKAGCKQNTRRAVALHRAPARAQEKAVGIAKTKPAAVSMCKGRGVGKATSSMLPPALRPGGTGRIIPGRAPHRRPLQA